MKRWLARGKLWDDIFTRTVSTLISASIIGIFLAIAGVIHVSKTAWEALGVVLLVFAVGFGLIAGLGTLWGEFEFRVRGVRGFPDPINELVALMIGLVTMGVCFSLLIWL